MTRVELTAVYPQLPDEEAGAWTNRVLSHAKEHGTNRQCSIGWHEECSDPQGFDCMCICHTDAVVWSVEGHPEGDLQVVTKVGPGKLHWPPAADEPAGTWAHWIYAHSESSAKAGAIAKQDAIMAGIQPTKEGERAGVTLTRDQLESWAGRALTDEEVETLDIAIPESSIPEAVAEIVSGLD